MAKACNALNDRDLFLSYLRSYFYDDPGLVLAILSPAHGEVQAAERIANHFISRVRGLLSFNAALFVAWSGTHRDVFPVRSGNYLKPLMAAAGRIAQAVRLTLFLEIDAYVRERAEVRNLGRANLRGADLGGATSAERQT
jgi:hypothetical protein